MRKKRWSKEEKLAILKEATEKGVEVTIRHYGVYPSTYYNWRKKYQHEGESGISDQASKRQEHQCVRQLEDEVSLLKQLLAERDIEIALRDELLKKKYPWARKWRDFTSTTRKSIG